MDSLKLVGKIKDAQGLKGEVYALIFSKEFSWAENLEVIFLTKTEDAKENKKYEIENLRTHKDGLVIKLKGISNRNQSEELKGFFLHAPASLFVSKKGETIYLSEIQGFTVYDGEVSIGPIVGFSSNGPQDLLVVEVDGKKYDIPFVEDFIDKIIFKERIVRMKLPPGLFE